MNLKEQYLKETNLEPESLAGTPTTGYVQWLEAKVLTQSTTPEVSHKAISNAIFRATAQRGWFHEKDVLDILSEFTITTK